MSNYDYQRGFSVYPDDSSGEIGKKLPYIDHGIAKTNKARYTSREEAKLEWDHLWKKTWVFSGVMQDIANVGDFFTHELGSESFVIVRTASDEIRAFYNVCPHRGNQLVHAQFGHINDRFRCAFHGWEFSSCGQLAKVRDELIFRKGVLDDLSGLKQVRCEAWKGLIFINMDLNAKSLLDHLGPVAAHLANYGFEKMRVFRDLEVCWDANWKTALDAFMEAYHFDDVHPEVLPISETLEVQYDMMPNGMSRMLIPIGYTSSRFEDRDQVSEAQKGMVGLYGGNPSDYDHIKGRDYKKALVDTKRKWGKRNGYEFFDALTDDQITDDWIYHIFPSITINAFADGLLVQLFRPHPTNPEKSYYNALTLLLPVGDPNQPVFDINSFGPEAFGPKGWDGSERPARFSPEKIEDLGYVLAQDARIIPYVQKGMRSEAFEGARLSESECRIRHYLAEIDRLMGRRNSADR